MFPPRLLLYCLLPLISAQESVLGVYIFHRHGDRTAKSWPPTLLTNLGCNEVWQSGSYYRNRYIDSNAASPILNINPDLVNNAQLNIQAPIGDNVLQTSAQAFLQGLYPPVGAALGSVEIANGSKVEAPLNGYQLIPIQPVSSSATGTNLESTTWLQGSSGCNNAIISSNDYFSTPEYTTTLNSTRPFYRSLLPTMNTTFTPTTAIYKNAYSIYDYIHVATINNLSNSIPSSDLLTPSTLYNLRTLADQHEFALAYNASEPVRAIAGRTLAAQILQGLNATVVGRSGGKPVLNMQFGTYAAFFSFFGMASLPEVSTNFTGIVDYASSMVFEVFTNSSGVTTASYPTTQDINVRFLFVNGTPSPDSNPLRAFPLFGSNALSLSWEAFVHGIQGFAVGDEKTWCEVCGNSTGVCASSSSSSGTATADGSGNGGISKAVAGVIGAMVTLAVVLGLESLILMLGGLRFVRRRKQGREVVVNNEGGATGGVDKLVEKEEGGREVI